MEKYTAIATVVWWFDNERITDYIAITEVSTFTDAAARIERSYDSENIESISIEFTSYEFLHLTKEMAEQIIAQDI
jgi:hypothetical protein